MEKLGYVFRVAQVLYRISLPLHVHKPKYYLVNLIYFILLLDMTRSLLKVGKNVSFLLLKKVPGGQYKSHLRKVQEMGI